MSSVEKNKEKLFTVSEYLELEEKSLEKNEYHNGKIMAMSGGSIPHGIITGNIITQFNNGININGKKCVTTSSDVKIFIDKANRFVYPDSMVICEEIKTHENDKNAIINPVLIIEVLSDLTASYDRGDKFHLYKSLPSFKEYILIDQRKPVVDVLFKEDATYWKMMTSIGLDKSIKIHSLGFDIKMSDIYANIPNLNYPQMQFDL